MSTNLRQCCSAGRRMAVKLYKNQALMSNTKKQLRSMFTIAKPKKKRKKKMLIVVNIPILEQYIPNIN